MRVLIVNTSENTGGAAIAARRLMCALNNNGESVRMLVRDKSTDNHDVIALGLWWLQRWRFLWERFRIYVYCKFTRKHLFDIDIATMGADITSRREFREADIIHLHWINQGMLSLGDIRKILCSGKPVVWTMHDIWPATALCHITHGCNKFRSRCQQCKYVPYGTADLARKTWKRKQRMLKGHNIHFVACSKWLAGEARRSALLAEHTILSIPNPIETDVFCARPKTEARDRIGLPRDKHIILFVSQRVTNNFKGMAYLQEACRKLVSLYPDMKDNTCVAILGGHADDVAADIPFKAYPLGYTSDTDRIVDVYSSCDVFVLPSLSENLPNTIMEAMSCSVPCIGFNVGGIPEMISHYKNGYVARYCDSDDLAAGIRWVLFDAEYERLAENARHKVVYDYSQKNVAMKYVEVYNHALAMKKYKL